MYIFISFISYLFHYIATTTACIIIPIHMLPQQLILMLIPLFKKNNNSALQKSIKAACWLWSLTVSLGSPALCSSSQVHFLSLFVSQKPSRPDSPVAGEATWNSSQLLRTGLVSSVEQNMWCISFEVRSSHLQLLIHTHLSDLEKFLFLFLLIIAQVLKFPSKTKVAFLYSLL